MFACFCLSRTCRSDVCGKSQSAYPRALHGRVPKRMPNGITSSNSTQPQPKRGVRSRDGMSKIISMGIIRAAANTCCAHPMKRFVVSNVCTLKRLKKSGVPLPFKAAKSQSNSSRFVTGGFGVVAPHHVGLSDQINSAETTLFELITWCLTNLVPTR